MRNKKERKQIKETNKGVKVREYITNKKKKIKQKFNI
jgi:hypothetical protein